MEGNVCLGGRDNKRGGVRHGRGEEVDVVVCEW